MQRILETMSPVFQIIQISNTVTVALPTSMITQPLFDATLPISEAAERCNQIFNSVDMVGLRKSLCITSELMRSPSMIEASNNSRKSSQIIIITYESK